MNRQTRVKWFPVSHSMKGIIIVLTEPDDPPCLPKPSSPENQHIQFALTNPASSHAPTRIPVFARARPLYLRPANNSVRRAKRDHQSALALREKTILSLFTVSIQGRQTSLNGKPTWTAIIDGDFHEEEPPFRTALLS